MHRLAGGSLVVMLVAALASCGGAGSADGPVGDVTVTLKDFSLNVEPATFASGDITFGIQNDGPSAHEFVVFRSDEEPGELPVDNGLIPEDQVDLVDEAEDIAPGTNTTLSVNLAAGSYVLVCNLSAHYEAGMYAGFTVA
jgi:uncharacterized cupredoxin-like copper-binding protein